MTLSNEPELNPFAGTVPQADLARGPVESEVDGKTIQEFRRQIHVLGGLWIFVGTAVFLAVAALWNSATEEERSAGWNPILLGTFSASGVLWLSLGAACFKKQMWAVYTGLTLSYLSLASNVWHSNVCGGAFILVVIVQAHRVIGAAGRMKEEGIPLDAMPQANA